MSNKHKKQQEVWDAEHKSPTVLLQMDSKSPSSGVTLFYDFLKDKNTSSGIEMCCGKGRNIIWLAEQFKKGYFVGIDFSPFAIETAQKRTKEKDVDSLAHFSVVDVTKRWPFDDENFDFGIDCFATTDIESSESRLSTVSELYRVIKSGGYILVYTLSNEDEFHKQMTEKSPASENGAFYHSTGKFEKTFSDQELNTLYKDFKLVEERRIEKETVFNEKKYKCNHFWRVYQKI